MIQKLGDIATYINGYAFKPADRGSKGLPIIRIQDLTGNSYDLGFYNGIYPKKIEINNGDILISWSGSLGIFLWNGGKALLNQHIFKVVFDKKDIDKHYFLFAVKEKLNEMSLKTHGATMKHIIKSDFENITISVPDLNEQKRISNMLLKIETLIKMRKNQIQHYNTLTKALFVEMFGDFVENPKCYKKEPIETHVDLLSGYPFKSSQYVDVGINICGGLIIMPQTIKWEDCLHWESTDGYEEYMLQENDIVMALDRPWISDGFKIAKVDAEHLPALLIQRTARIRAIDINQEYLYYCFIIGGFERHSSITGSLVPHISLKDIRSFQILIPPLKLQEQFADIVGKIDKHKSVVQKSLDETQLLFDSLMQKYFG